jgi:phage terminase small subunit
MSATAYDKLTDKQRRFVDRYIVHLQAGRAADEAGYGTKRPDQAATRLLAMEHVRAAIEERLRRDREKSELDEAWVLERLRRVAEWCMQAKPVLDSDGNPTGEYRFDAAGANRSLELIGKHFAMFTDNVNVRDRDLDRLPDDEIDRRIADLQREARTAAVTH